MRNKQEIIEKAQSLFDAAMVEFIKSRTCKAFRNCKHNCSLMAKSIGKVHYCQLKTKVSEDGNIKKLFVCDTDEYAQKCQEFERGTTAEESKKEFMDIVSNPSRCGGVFPRLSSLLWVLNDGKKKNDLSAIEKIQPHGHEEKKEEEKGSIGRSLLKFLRGQ